MMIYNHVLHTCLYRSAHMLLLVRQACHAFVPGAVIKIESHRFQSYAAGWMTSSIFRIILHTCTCHT